MSLCHLNTLTNCLCFRMHLRCLKVLASRDFVVALGAEDAAFAAAVVAAVAEHVGVAPAGFCCEFFFHRGCFE